MRVSVEAMNYGGVVDDYITELPVVEAWEIMVIASRAATDVELNAGCSIPVLQLSALYHLLGAVFPWFATCLNYWS